MTIPRRLSDNVNRRSCLVTIVVAAILFAGCSNLQRPKVEPFYAVTAPPKKQELRWSNGKMPSSLDPARAAAAPETDLVRAIYEGLTDLDSKNLAETPGVAEKWESTADLRTWTFHLRKDARWSNGERVTARDFVRSWKRLVRLREKAVNRHLFQNIIGMRVKDADIEKVPDEPSDFLPQSSFGTEPDSATPVLEQDGLPRSQLSAAPAPGPQIRAETSAPPSTETRAPAALGVGVEALDDFTLKVRLELPDKDFPKLISSPIFRPIYGNGSNFDQAELDPATVTNGAFRIAEIAGGGVTLERSDNYWNKKSVVLERVRFVAANTVDAVLDAYKKGEVDVVTNAAFEPLALKLLTPYDDFRRTAHGALNFYEFNTDKPVFSDRRVREALAIALDRQKLTEADLEGAAEPADKFFPLGEPSVTVLSYNAQKAKALLEKAGYSGGIGFPPIRLVINRNNTQHRVARSVARMWKENLNIDTIIVVKETSEIEAVRKSGDFDLLRRGVVFPANDELVNLSAILGSGTVLEKPSGASTPGGEPGTRTEIQEPAIENETDKSGRPAGDLERAPLDGPVSIQTEDDAIFELRVIPLYFPTSHSLVKPYVRGFETNGLDAPALRDVSIDINWQAAAKP